MQPPHSTRTAHKRLGPAAIIVILILGLTVFFGKTILFGFSALTPGSSNSSIIEVKKGEGPIELTKLLVVQGAIQDAKSFIWLGRITRQWKKIKAGEYKVSPAMSPIEIYAVITSGVSVFHPITVREGENMYEVADDIEEKGLAPKEAFLKYCKDAAFIAAMGLTNPTPPTLEGYLFPDTYFFNRSSTPEEMARQMVHHFNTIWTQAEKDRARSLGFNRHQLITLASIIEKETGAPEERPMISSVFHNRLKKHMRLQSDPTTIYGMWERYEGKIHKKDLSVANSYNTYSVAALPIGPVSNPGREAIHAALYPNASEYLYFVSHNNGTHQFSRSFEEHNAAVRKFQLDPKMREGKSWRDRLVKVPPEAHEKLKSQSRPNE